MEVAKTFDRNGVRYRPGDPLPEGLDKVTMEHYKRHGMVREAKPSETKPSAPTRRRATAPKPSEPAAEIKPAEAKGESGSTASEAEMQEAGTAGAAEASKSEGESQGSDFQGPMTAEQQG